MIPANFDPPRSFRFDTFQLAVLGPAFADADYAAVLASAEQIRHVFGPANDWPKGGISEEENRDDLVRHEREFSERVAFAYCLLDPRGEDYLGCLYLRPISSTGANDCRLQRFDAQAFVWLTTGQSATTDARAHAVLTAWLATHWPFLNVAWPGRSPGWDEWARMAGG